MPKNAPFLEENAKLFGETRQFSRSITTKFFYKGRRHADIRQHRFATCMMIALPAAEVFRGRRSREKIEVVYVPMGGIISSKP